MSRKLMVEEPYIRPEKANERMKMAHNIRQTVYLYGISGYGKTSFVANYLGRRVYEYYTAEEISEISIPQGRLPGKERIVVIDDLYLLHRPGMQEQALPIIQALAEHPDVWLVLISRADVPVWLKHLEVRYLFVRIGEAELALSDKEAESYLKQWNLTILEETLQEAQQLYRGCPLGFKVLAMQLQRLPKELQGHRRRDAEKMVLEKTRQEICDFFEANVYDSWEPELLDFLMKISVTEEFDLQMARIITKRNNIGELLKTAREKGNFMLVIMNADGEISYRFREDFVQSMEKLRSERYTDSQLEILYQNAGNACELKGDIPRALVMYERSGKSEEITRLLIENARIHPGAGYYWQLRRYYLNLPESYITGSPDMMSAMSMLQSIMLNDEESERWYGKLQAFADTHKGALKRQAQERMLYLDIGLPHRGSMHIESLVKKTGQLIRMGGHILPELSLTNNQPSIMNGGKDFSEWTLRDRALENSIGIIIERLLGQFGKGVVNLAMAESYFEKGIDDSEVFRRAIKGKMQAEKGGKLEMIFVGTGLLAKLEMFSGAAGEAVEMLDDLKERAEKDAPLLTQGIDTLKTELLLRTGDMEGIREWLNQCPNEDVEFCTLERYRYLVKAKVYILQGKFSKAIKLLNMLILYAEERGRTYLNIEANLILAIALYKDGKQHYKGPLQQAVSQAEKYHFVRVLAGEGAAVLDMLADDTVIYKDPDFREKVLERCREQAGYYPSYLASVSDHTPLLSEKALQILKYQAEGLSVEEIAGKVGLSQAGVKYNNTETYKKLGVKGKTAAISEARRRNLI